MHRLDRSYPNAKVEKMSNKELTEKNYVPNNKEAKEKAVKELTKQQVKQ